MHGCGDHRKVPWAEVQGRKEDLVRANSAKKGRIYAPFPTGQQMLLSAFWQEFWRMPLSRSRDSIGSELLLYFPVPLAFGMGWAVGDGVEFIERCCLINGSVKV